MPDIIRIFCRMSDVVCRMSRVFGFSIGIWSISPVDEDGGIKRHHHTVVCLWCAVKHVIFTRKNGSVIHVNLNVSGFCF